MSCVKSTLRVSNKGVTPLILLVTLDQQDSYYSKVWWPNTYCVSWLRTSWSTCHVMFIFFCLVLVCSIYKHCVFRLNHYSVVFFFHHYTFPEITLDLAVFCCLSWMWLEFFKLIDWLLHVIVSQTYILCFKIFLVSQGKIMGVFLWCNGLAFLYFQVKFLFLRW